MYCLLKLNDKVAWLISKSFVSFTWEADFSLVRETWLHLNSFLFSDRLCGFAIMLCDLSFEFNVLYATVIELEQSAIKKDNNILWSWQFMHPFATIGIAKHTAELVSAIVFQLVCEWILRSKEFFKNLVRVASKSITTDHAYLKFICNDNYLHCL
jgi:hypothetical protein